MKKLLLLVIQLIFVYVSKADTIANWQVYYNGYEIVRLNEHNIDNLLKFGSQLIQKNDILTVNYFNDTPCMECNTYLYVLSGAKLAAKIKGKGTFAPRKIDLYKLSKFNQDTFKVYHYESMRNENKTPKLLFTLIIEEDSVVINKALSEIEYDTLKASFITLTDSKTTYQFGHECGFAPEKPKGRIAIEILKKRNRFDLIKLVLYGKNQTGKLYAIEELLKSGTKDKELLTNTDKLLIKRTIQKDLPIETCGGCFLWETSTSELFKIEYYKDLLDKNDIEL